MMKSTLNEIWFSLSYIHRIMAFHKITPGS